MTKMLKMINWTDGVGCCCFDVDSFSFPSPDKALLTLQPNSVPGRHRLYLQDVG